MSDAEQVEAIKRLKYKYMRCIDTKNWKEMAECFTEDATCAYDSGRFSFQGRDQILGFLDGAMGRPTLISMHHVHHPEIELTSGSTATGRWYLEDYLIDTQHGTGLHGAAFYRDEYVKVGDEWKFKRTGYERVFEEVFDRKGMPSLRVTKSMFPAD
jgi:hypothetical protein